METLLNLLVSFIGTTTAAIVGILTYNLSIKKNKEQQKKTEQKEEYNKIIKLFHQRDEVSEQKRKQTVTDVELAIEKNIMPLITTIQIQQENLQSQVNTIMNELIDNTKQTNNRLNKLEIQIAVNSVKK